ncbi:nucleotidyltransferase family protein [Exiguobacterium qingdaonense]|uniref:tRNA(Met) cytidine acetate ligase n=1 Tax=Exiguobacterium qingdaonense TaxID=2751251 RepID=UPI001BEAC455|nr:nucleotidyltransferase family protein [Exiguobacterium qingdaonense]
MQKTAIIAEYNPFHNGHFFQAQTARRETEADVMIAIMSAQFTQRGEPASFDKWKRAAAAVESGAIDLVVELPTKYGVQRADRFASAAVSIAERLRCQTLSFGSESGDVDAIVHAARSNAEETPLYKETFRQALQEGHSSAQASSRAFRTVYPSFDLTRPNNILAYHYAKAAQSIQLHTVKRLGADYHDLSLVDIMSATGIRAHYLDTGEVRAVPASTAAMFRSQPMTHWEHYWPVLRFKLRTLPLHTLTELVGIDASLAPRLQQAGVEPSFERALAAVSTRRYTRTAIQRAFVAVLLHWQKEDAPTRFDDVPYVRPLAFNELGRQALRDVKEDVPLVSKFDARLDFEARVTEAYRLPLQHDALIEHRQRPQFISSK